MMINLLLTRFYYTTVNCGIVDLDCPTHPLWPIGKIGEETIVMVKKKDRIEREKRRFSTSNLDTIIYCMTPAITQSHTTKYNLMLYHPIAWLR